MSTLRKVLREFFFPSAKALPEGQLKAVNVTRAAVLATRLEVAGSGAKRRKGLLGRKDLGSGEGLWIVPCESVHTFFMHFAIDLVYLDRGNRVKKMKNAMGPWRLSACFSAHSVLELAAGTIRETQTQRGDMVEFEPVSNPDAEL